MNETTKAGLVLLNTQKGMNFGIDYYTYKVGDLFMGFKEIPKGIHFLSYSTEDTVPNTSFFEYFEEDEVKVFEWNTKEEDFKTVSKEIELEMIYKFKNNKMYQHIAPYPLEIYKIWCGLSNQITKDILSKIEPVKKNIFPISDNNSESKYHIYFTEIPKQLSLKNKTASEISKMCFDKTEILESILKKNSQQEFLLGELQFSFILFLIGQNYNGFDQWKKILDLFCNCDDAVEQYPKLFSKFISILEFQLETTPDDFFIQDFTSENFLTKSLVSLFEIVLNEDEKNEELKKKTMKMKLKIEKKFKIKFDELEEDLPVIVEI